jgi:hypothetical protein
VRLIETRKENKTPLSEMLNKSQKLGLGIAVLLVVDVLWVASSEATKVS